MKLSALLNGIESESKFRDVEIERVTDKIQDVTQKTLFVCIDGNHCDGHQNASEAVKNGASAVVTQRDLKIENQITVKDTREAFSLIASNFYGRPSEKLKLIGVTGTNGKTSTSFFIKSILNDLSEKCGLIGTVKNSYGDGETESVLTTPEPMELQKLLSEMVSSGCKYCVMEVSSQALAQKRVSGLKFECGILTNITPEHLDYHINMENYIAAKLSLFDMCDTAVLNIDDENIAASVPAIKTRMITCSAKSNSADYTAKNIVCNEDGVRYEYVGLDCISRISVCIPGIFTVYNSLLAVTALKSLNFDLDDISVSAKRIESVKGRAEKVDVPADFTVIIDYAHTPDGLKNILSCVRSFTKGRVITVFGCGGDRDKSKRAEMGRIVGEISDMAVVTSDNPRNENPILIINDIFSGMECSKAKLAVIENRHDAIIFALKKAKAGDTVLLAGKGHETYQITGNQKNHFDEREIVNNYFKS